MVRGGIALALAGALAACASLPDTPGPVSLTIAGPPIPAEQTGQAYLYTAPQLPEGYDGGGIMAQHWSMLGREDKSAAADPSEYRARSCPLAEGHATGWGQTLDRIAAHAQDTRIVIVNESHTVTRHRDTTRRLLERLRPLGFTVFAAETFANVDEVGQDPVERLAGRTYPHRDLGYYSREPAFGRMLRTAIAEGYRLVAYEHVDEHDDADSEQGEDDQFASISMREAGQAENLAAIVAAMGPDQKLLVHVGYAHASESAGPGPDGRVLEWMAKRLKALTGIDPLTVGQTVCRRTGAGEVLLIPMPRGEGAPFDFALDHPVDEFAKSRPQWRRSADSAVPIPMALRPTDAPLVIEAVEENADFDAVPVDRVYVEPGEDIPLLLPPGRYSVRAVRLTE